MAQKTKTITQTSGVPKPIITQEQFNAMLNDPRMKSVPPNEAMAYLQSRGFEFQGVKKMGPAPSTQYGQTKSEVDTEWSQLPGNILPSGGRLLKETIGAVTHPKRTVKALGGLGLGVAEKLLPGEAQIRLQGVEGDEEAVNAVGRYFVDRYGSPENIKQTIINDPVGFAADLSGLISGGAGGTRVASKVATVAGATKTATKLTKASDLLTKVSPIDQAIIKGLKGTEWMKNTLGTIKDTRESTKIQKVIDRRLTELDSLEANNSVIRKAVNESKSKGIDVKQILAETDLLKDSVDVDGTIRTSKEGGAIEQLTEFIKPQEKVIGEALAREGKSINLNDLKAQMETALGKSTVMGANKKAALKAIEDEIDGLDLDADADGNILLSQLQDAKINKYATINYANPTSKVIDKLIAKALKEAIEKNTKSVDVKALNSELASHYATLKFLEKLDGKKVKGGRLGKYFGQTIGVITGSHFGPLGALAGAKVGEMVQGATMASKFRGTTGKVLESSEAMKKAMSAETQSGNASLRNLQTKNPTMTAVNMPIEGSISEGAGVVKGSSVPTDDMPVEATTSEVTGTVGGPEGSVGLKASSGLTQEQATNELLRFGSKIDKEGWTPELKAEYEALIKVADKGQKLNRELEKIAKTYKNKEAFVKDVESTLKKVGNPFEDRKKSLSEQLTRQETKLLNAFYEYRGRPDVMAKYNVNPGLVDDDLLAGLWDEANGSPGFKSAGNTDLLNDAGLAEYQKLSTEIEDIASLKNPSKLLLQNLKEKKQRLSDLFQTGAFLKKQSDKGISIDDIPF